VTRLAQWVARARAREVVRARPRPQRRVRRSPRARRSPRLSPRPNHSHLMWCCRRGVHRCMHCIRMDNGIQQRLKSCAAVRSQAARSISWVTTRRHGSARMRSGARPPRLPQRLRQRPQPRPLGFLRLAHDARSTSVLASTTQLLWLRWRRRKKLDPSRCRLRCG